MPYAPFICRFQSGPMILQIVQIGPVDNRGYAELVGLGATDPIQFVFAEKTAIHRILRIRRICQFMGLKDNVTAAQATGEFFGSVEIPRRRAG